MQTFFGGTCLSRCGEGSQSRLKGCAECMCVFGGGALSLLLIRVWEYRCGFMRAPTCRWALLLFFLSLFTFVHKTAITDGFVAWRAQQEGVSPFNVKVHRGAHGSPDGNTFQWRARLRNRPQCSNCCRVKWNKSFRWGTVSYYYANLQRRF